MGLNTGIEGLYMLTQRMYQTMFGLRIAPEVAANTTVTIATAASKFIYCIKPLGAAATITSAKDLNGTAITGLAGISIAQSDEFKFPLKEIVFTGTLAIYYADSLSNVQN